MASIADSIDTTQKSRAGLMKGSLVVVTYAADQPYSCILESCGAIVLRLYPHDGKTAVSQEKITSRYLRTVAPDCTRFLVFWDEMGAASGRPLPILPELMSLSLGIKGGGGAGGGGKGSRRGTSAVCVPLCVRLCVYACVWLYSHVPFPHTNPLLPPPHMNR